MMKKCTAILLILSLLVFSLAGCSLFGQKPWEDPSLSEEDRAIRAVSDPVVMEHYGLKDLSSYSIEITKDIGDEIGVKYTFCLHGYRTGEMATVYLSQEDYSFVDARFDTPEYSPYLSLVTEQEVRDAAAKLDEQITPYGENQIGYYYQLRDGVLSLCTELIVSIQPTEEQIKQGFTSGCNIDHKHLTFQEIVYSPE